MKHYQENAIQKQYPLSSKKPLKKSIKYLFFLADILVIFLVVYALGIFQRVPSINDLVTNNVVMGVIITFIVLSVLMYVYQYWYYKTYFYNLTDDYIIIKKGVFAPQEITVPYERIQDIYVDQDIFDRFFGLYDVHISSATYTSGVQAHIDGVEKPAAEALRERLLQRVRAKMGR